MEKASFEISSLTLRVVILVEREVGQLAMAKIVSQGHESSVLTNQNMSEHPECALPKNESSWLKGIQLKSEADASLRQDIEKFKREIEKISDPNCGRIGELKEKIKKKTLVTREAVEESAERLAAIFLGKKPQI